eukprot:g911.t1
MDTRGQTDKLDNRDRKRMDRLEENEKKRKRVAVEDTSTSSKTKEENVECNSKKGRNASVDTVIEDLEKEKKMRGRLKKALKRTRKGQATAEDIDVLRKSLDGVARLEDAFGNIARIKLALKKSFFSANRRLGKPEVRSLLTWTLSNKVGKNPKWIAVENKPLVRLVLLVTVEENIKGEKEAFAKGRRVITCEFRSSRDNLEIKDVAEAVMCVTKATTTSEASDRIAPIVVDIDKRQGSRDGGGVHDDVAAASTTAPGVGGGGCTATTTTTIITTTTAPTSGGDSDSPPPLPRPSPETKVDDARRRRLLELGGEIASRWRHSERELSEGEYPKSCPGGFLATTPREKVDATKEEDMAAAAVITTTTRTGRTRDLFEPIVAIDCEMCRTEHGLELTRATALNWDGDVLLDELVQPERPILDYLTKYSGITEAMMRDVTTSLEDVRDRLMRFIKAETIAIGHSLQCDMKALKLFHRNVLDTAILYPHPAGPPKRNKLRYITKRFLKRNIQQRGANGHDSKEDALAALDLVKLKVSRGGSFGMPETVTRESFFTEFQTHCKDTDLFCVSARKSVLRAHESITNVTSQACTTDVTALEYTAKLLGQEKQRPCRTKLIFASVADATFEDLARSAKALPINGIMIVVSRKRSTNDALKELAKRRSGKRAGTWSPEEESAFRQKVRMTQDAVVHVTFNNDRSKTSARVRGGAEGEPPSPAPGVDDAGRPGAH